MAFKYIKGKIVPVKHKTVFGLLAGNVSAVYAWRPVVLYGKHKGRVGFLCSYEKM